jgi:MOSC domain-containing protein YiiM
VSDAKVVGLSVGPAGAPARLTRESRDELEFIEGKGVVGDKNFGRSPTRHVNLVSRHSYDWFLRSFGRERPMPGGFGEQITISAELDPNWLPLGQRLQVGEAILEVVTPRTPCDSFREAVGADKVSHFVGHVGLMCAVVKSGKARMGDPVTRVD